MAYKIGKGSVYAFVILFALFCFLPFYLVVVGSFTSESYIRTHGYGLLPGAIDWTAYKVIFLNSKAVFNGYRVSLLVLVIATPLSLFVNAMMAYTIANRKAKYRNVLSFYAYFTILFNGGIVPWYIINVNVLHLQDTMAALILPYLANAMYILFIVNYFRGIPPEIHESAVVDGAGEWRIFLRIYMPLSVPVLASVGLFIALGYWNDWWLGIMLINKTELQPLQLLLRTIVSNADFLKNQAGSFSATTQLSNNLPTEGIKMATCVITVGPIIFFYPFIQKYFVKGIMIGAVKG